MRKAILLLFTTWRIADACSCKPPVPICTRIDRAAALFIGDVLSSSDDGSGTFAQLTLERVRVVEVFKGLPADIKEVWLDPGSGTSCYGNLPPGKRYFIEAIGVGQAKGEISRYSTNYRGQSKPLPPGFDPATATIVSTMECTNTTELKPGNPDVEFLRASMAGQWKTVVTGRVNQIDQLSALFQPSLPVEGMTVRLTGANGPERRTTTDQEGNFTFPNSAPGVYKIDFEKPGFAPLSQQQVNVPAVGCGWAYAQANANGRVRLRITDHLGRPIPDLPVDMEYEREGKLTALYDRNSKTDQEGILDRSGLPAATWVIAVNPNGPRDPKVPYPTTFYPGVPSSDAAVRIRLAASASRLDLAMKLPPPIQVRSIRVRVIGKDGTPQAGAQVFSAHSRGGRTDENGTITLHVLSGFEEVVHAWKEFDTETGGRMKQWIDYKRWLGDAKVPGKQGDAEVEVRFERWVRNGDEVH